MVDAVCRAIYHSQGGKTSYTVRKMSPWTNYSHDYLQILIKKATKVFFKTPNCTEVFRAL